MQINPQEKIALAALVADTTDSTTYYCKVVMRESITNTVLDSVNLTRDPNNARRFYGYLVAPSNNTPTGRYINLTTTFYTDSGYTSPAPNLPETLVEHIVDYRWDETQDGGTGDPFVSAGDIVEKAISKHVVKLMPLHASVGKLHKAMTAPRSSAKGKDDKEVIQATKDMQEAFLVAIKGILKEQDHSAAIAEIKSLVESMKSLVQSGEGASQESKQAIMEATQKIGAAADTIVASHLYSSMQDKSQMLPPPPAPPSNDGSLGQGLADNTIEGARAPSKGVLPVHIIQRNRKAFAPKAEQPIGIRLPEEELANLGKDTSGRQPSHGVVPEHILRRNKKAMTTGPLSEA